MITKKGIRILKRYCRDNIKDIKGYKEAINSSKKYHCHHINELTFTKDELKKMNMYYNRPASELVLLTHSEHSKLHQRHNMPSARVGSRNGMYGRESAMRHLKGDKHPRWQGGISFDHKEYMRQYRAKKRALRDCALLPQSNSN
jgi:hypothetical protein